MSALGVFLASFVLVSVKAFQQLNVVHHRTLAIWPTSLVFAFAEVVVIGAVVKSGSFWVAVPMWLGGASGCTLSMVLHKRWRDHATGRGSEAVDKRAADGHEFP